MLRSIGPKLLAVDGFSELLSPSRVLIVAHIHCLPSYSKLLGYMIDEIGFDPSKIIVIPKAYSTVPETLHELKAMGIRVEASIGKNPGWSTTTHMPPLRLNRLATLRRNLLTTDEMHVGQSYSTTAVL